MANITQLLLALSNLPQTHGVPSLCPQVGQLPVGPITPPFIPEVGLPATIGQPEPSPPRPPRRAEELLPEILAQTRGIFGPTTPPYNPVPTTTPAQQGLGAILRSLLGAIPQGIAVATSPDPGQALQGV